MAYSGVPKETVAFLAALSRNNNKAWMDEHRVQYKEQLVEPAMALVEAMAPELRKLSPDIHAEPKIGGSVMRFNRDIRFSKDKRPYKDHMDLWFWQGDKGRSGYWFRLTPKRLVLGAGAHTFEKDALERYREAVGAESTGKALQKAVDKAERTGYHIGGEAYKRVPRGFDTDHPRERLLRHGALTVGADLPHPKELHTSSFPKFCVSRYRQMKPIQEWLAAL
jgi:uncharacterized protein (TIGR02453 family)